MKIGQFDWFIKRIQTQVGFGWLSESSDKKNFTLENFLQINRFFSLTSHCNTAVMGAHSGNNYTHI